jgi:hypothetical protein
MRTGTHWIVVVGVCLLAVTLAGGALAQDKAAAPAAAAAETKPAEDPIKTLTTQAGDMKVAMDTMWVLVTAFLSCSS